MYLHLGEDAVVNSKSIVSIIDLESTTVSNITREYLKKAQKSGIVKTITRELPKSAVVCEKKGEETVYISQISAITLQKRVQNGLWYGKF